jgi:glycosyltransferase involved in cell wall biosynthesis
VNDIPKVSLVIPVFNRAFMLDKVIRCLLAQTYENIEIIFVDDGSGDGSFEILSRYPEIKIHRQENRGPAAARNAGIGLAEGEILHFIDSDVIAPKNLVADHVKYHLKYTNCIVQGQVVRILNLDDAFRVPMGFAFYARPFFATGNVSVRKKFVEAAGGFDEVAFRKGWEDLDLGIRLRKMGLKVKRLYKKGYVWHYETDVSSIEQVQKFFQNRYSEGRSAVRFYRKHPTFQVKMMTMSGRFFFLMNALLFNSH